MKQSDGTSSLSWWKGFVEKVGFGPRVKEWESIIIIIIIIIKQENNEWRIVKD